MRSAGPLRRLLAGIAASGITWRADDGIVRSGLPTPDMCPLVGTCFAVTGVKHKSWHFDSAAIDLAGPRSLRAAFMIAREADGGGSDPYRWRQRVVKRALLIACNLEPDHV